jgi:ABC-type transporter Mla subunit MlaD
VGSIFSAAAAAAGFYAVNHTCENCTYGEVNTDQLARAVEVLGKQVQGLPPLVPRAMDNLKRLSKVMSDRRDQFGSMLKTMDLVTATLRRQQGSIGAMVNQGQQLFGEFVMRRAAFHQMIASINSLIRCGYRFYRPATKWGGRSALYLAKRL